MAITCVITYQIEPHQREDFLAYARVWEQVIPAAGADLIGYFAPYEGSLTTAYGLYSLPDMGAYEAYRTRLAQDPRGRENFRFAQDRQFIRTEDRIFTRRIGGGNDGETR